MSGWPTIHSSARAPPIEPPTTAATSVMPSAASAATSASTWSRTEISGNLEPQGFPSGASELGPGRAAAAAQHVGGDRAPAVGVDRRARPGNAVPPAGGRVARARPGPVMCESPVSACSTTTTLSRFGDSSPHRCTAMRDVVDDGAVLQRQRADVDDADFAFGGQRLRWARRRSSSSGSSERRHGVRSPCPARCGRTSFGRGEALARGRRGCRRCPRCRPPAAPGPGVTPVASCSSGVSWACVVDAGWITSDRTSPMLATWLCSVSALTNALPASTPPASSNASTAPVPLGASFFPSSYHGELGRPGVVDRQHVRRGRPGTRRPAARWRRGARRAGSASPGPGRPGTR